MPDIIKCDTDHKPLYSVFNGNRKGSFRTKCIKLQHQDIHFWVLYQPGKSNQTDFMSHNGKPFNKLPTEEQTEVEDMNNLLYILHTTPVIDHISLAMIAQHTSSDTTLKHLHSLIRSGKTWIHDSAKPNLKRFAPILSEITSTGNGILLEGERIILPESLHDTAICLAHKGSHPGRSGLAH